MEKMPLWGERKDPRRHGESPWCHGEPSWLHGKPIQRHGDPPQRHSEPSWHHDGPSRLPDRPPQRHGESLRCHGELHGKLLWFLDEILWGHGDPLRCTSDSVMVSAVALGRSVYDMSVHKMFPTRYLASLPLNLTIFSINSDTT